MSALTDRIDTLNDRANCLFGYVLLGKATEADIIEFERSSAALQDALCEASTERVLAAANAVTDARGLPRLIPTQRYCADCECAFETTDPDQRLCAYCGDDRGVIPDEAQRRAALAEGERVCPDCFGVFTPRAGLLTRCYSCYLLYLDHLDQDDEFPEEDTDALVGPLRIDREALEAWYESQTDIPY